MRAPTRTRAGSRTASLPDIASGRLRPVAKSGTRTEVRSAGVLSWLVIVFLASIFLPWLWQIGSLAISPYRLVLLFTVLPCLVLWARGKAGAIRAADIAICLYCVWCAVSLVAVHGADAALQPAGMIAIETAGAYFLGRCFIRSAEQFRAMSRLLFLIVAALFPFAVMEAILNYNILLAFFSKFFPVHVLALNDPRWGLRRVQTVFEHPILFGVSTGAILALVHLVVADKQAFARRWLASAIVLVTASLSLSAGPMSALTVQILLLSWNWLLRDSEMRWRILWGLILLGYIFISLVSNQTVPEFLLTHFSFDQASAYYRVLIWHFGSASALNHPFFGVGFNRWDRPDWMPGSIDMFWLYHAMLFGIPAALLMGLGFLSTVISVSRAKGLDATLVRYRIAFLIVMSSYFLAGWTVHFWNATFALFMFLLGSGAWLADAGSGTVPDRGRGRESVRQPARIRPDLEGRRRSSQ